MIFSALVVMLLRIVSAQNGSFHAVSIGSGLTTPRHTMYRSEMSSKMVPNDRQRFE
jgi:hypothetical protein